MADREAVRQTQKSLSEDSCLRRRVWAEAFSFSCRFRSGVFRSWPWVSGLPIRAQVLAVLAAGFPPIRGGVPEAAGGAIAGCAGEVLGFPRLHFWG